MLPHQRGKFTSYSVAFYIGAKCVSIYQLLCPFSLLMYYYWLRGQGYKKTEELLQDQLKMVCINGTYCIYCISWTYKCRKTWLMTFWKFRFHINVYINTCTTCVWWRFGNLIHVIQISDQYMKYGNSTLMFQQGRNEMLKTRSLKRGFPSLGNHTETPSFQHVFRWFPWRELRHSDKFPVWGNDYARSNFIEEWMR